MTVDLVGASEAARIAGVTRSAVVKAHERGTMPDPVPIGGSGVLVWRRVDVEQWARTRRKPGRPRTHE